MPFDGNVLGDDTEATAGQARAVRPGYKGFAALGDLLGGGATQRAEAKAPVYAGQAADAAFKFNRASEERAKAIIAGMQQTSREGLPDALGGVYTDPKQAALAQAILGSAATPNMRNLDNFERPGYVALNNEQQAASAAGNFKRANAITAVLGDKQFEPVIEKGGAYIENGATLGDLDAIPTPESLSRIEQHEAATRQGQQRTNASVARSNRPPAPRASHSSAPDEEAAILQQARDAIAKGASKDAVKKRLEDRGYSKVAGHL